MHVDCYIYSYNRGSFDQPKCCTDTNRHLQHFRRGKAENHVFSRTAGNVFLVYMINFQKYFRVMLQTFSEIFIFYSHFKIFYLNNINKSSDAIF